MYTDSLVHDENALKYLVTTMGEDNVVLGTDYPFPLGELHPGKLIESIQDWPNSTKVLTNNTSVKGSYDYYQDVFYRQNFLDSMQ